LTAGDLDGCDAGVAGERVGAGEPRWSAGASDEPSTEHGSDPVDLGEAAGVLFERASHPLRDCSEAFVECPDVLYEVPGDVFAGSFGRRGGSDGPQFGGGDLGGERETGHRQGSGRASARGAGSPLALAELRDWRVVPRAERTTSCGPPQRPRGHHLGEQQRWLRPRRRSRRSCGGRHVRVHAPERSRSWPRRTRPHHGRRATEPDDNPGPWRS